MSLIRSVLYERFHCNCIVMKTIEMKTRVGKGGRGGWGGIRSKILGKKQIENPEEKGGWK